MLSPSIHPFLTNSHYFGDKKSQRHQARRLPDLGQDPDGFVPGANTSHPLDEAIHGKAEVPADLAQQVRQPPPSRVNSFEALKGFKPDSE